MRCPAVLNNEFPELNGNRTWNPAFMNGADLQEPGLRSGDVVEIVSDTATIPGVVEEDNRLRRGLVSMSHAWGGPPERDGEVRQIGGNTGRLASTVRAWDRYCGMPVMSNTPVQVRRRAGKL